MTPALARILAVTKVDDTAPPAQPGAVSVPVIVDGYPDPLVWCDTCKEATKHNFSGMELVCEVCASVAVSFFPSPVVSVEQVQAWLKRASDRRTHSTVFIPEETGLQAAGWKVSFAWLKSVKTALRSTPEWKDCSIDLEEIEAVALAMLAAAPHQPEAQPAEPDILTGWPRKVIRPAQPAEDEAVRKAVLDNLPYLENLILPAGHESAVMRNHPAPCIGHDFCLMRQAQKGADAIRAEIERRRQK